MDVVLDEAKDLFFFYHSPGFAVGLPEFDSLGIILLNVQKHNLHLRLHKAGLTSAKTGFRLETCRYDAQV